MLTITVAEKAAYAFMEKHKPKFKLATINPSMVFGPALNDFMSESVEGVIYGIFHGTFPMVLDLAWSCVDVRDVALAHILALEVPSAEGRYVCVSETFHLRDLVAIIKKHYPKAPLPSLDMTGSVGSALAYVTAFFYPAGTRDFLQTNIKRAPRYDNSKIKKSLGIKFMTAEETIIDTIKDLVAKKKVTIQE